ncbi:MAG: acyl-CoA dehydrogenase family protein [Lentisphaeria bacterium]|nr:acyl-CoA dehydrogenase family protein [Lentisphaeria bacterium]
MHSNYFSDNPDLLFHLQNPVLEELSTLREDDFRQAERFPQAPTDFAAALALYVDKLSLLGRLCAEEIAPRASAVDREGAHFEQGKVSYAKDSKENLRLLTEAGLMGVTLPREYGGLNFPCTVYTMMTEMVSRADASLQNLFGLQDIAKTILLFGDEQMRQKYLPRFASGEADGAMALTEPEAGSDLQSVQTSAVPDPDSGRWLLNGHKHFITNGCARIILVLARSEPGSVDGRGLSLFLLENGPGVEIKSIEDKLGLHGSPTCELLFHDAPAQLIGQRRRGLTRYVMSLMNGARLAIAAQAQGIAEAAYRLALEYCGKREQFGKTLRQLAPVSEMLLRMKVNIMAGRSLLYETSRYVDLRDSYEYMNSQNPEASVENRQKEKQLARIAALLTPLSKAFNAEMCNQVCYDSIQCLGGKGYMREQKTEQLYRDARITNIYEGTTQMQVVAAIGGIMQRTLEPMLDEMAALTYSGRLADMASEIAKARKVFNQARSHVEAKADGYFFDLMARRLVAMQTSILIAYIMLRDARNQPDRQSLCQCFVDMLLPEINKHSQIIHAAEKIDAAEKEKILGL